MNGEVNNSTKKKKWLGILLGSIAFAVSYYGVQQLFKKDLEAELTKIAIELNKKTPMQLDQFTRLDSLASKGKTNFMYYYTLLEAEKSEVNVDTINKYLRPKIIENASNNAQLKAYRKQNVTLDYLYYDRNGEFVMQINVEPDM